MYLCKITLSFIITFLPFICFGQLTSFTDDFEDGILTGWEVPAGQEITYDLAEQEGILKINYHRVAGSWEWDNFNFTPPEAINVNASPMIALKVKSSINTQLTIKPIYGDSLTNDWLQGNLTGDNQWHFYLIDLVNYSAGPLTRIYFYLDGGTTAPVSGLVAFDDFSIGDDANILYLYNLTAVAVDSHQIDLNWQINFPERVNYYNIYRSEVNGFICNSQTFLDTALTRNYHEQNLPVNTTFFYRVTAVDTLGIESLPSEQVNATTYAGGMVPIIYVQDVNTENVGLYQKFEILLGMEYVLYDNPYDPEQIDVRAFFTSPSGNTWEIFGFYDNYLNADQWKVRFSPNEVGVWSYFLQANNLDSTGISPVYYFTAVNSDRHGWLKVSSINPHYLIQDDGTSFYGVGAYYPWGVSNGPTGLAYLEASGANMWGYWNINYGNEGNFIESLLSGLGRYDQPKCGRIDQLINWSEERDLKMMFAIWPHDLLCLSLAGWAQQWPNNPYQFICNVQDFYSSAEAWEYQKKQYRYIIARWGYSQSMGIWEIINEINGTDGWAAGHQAEATVWVDSVHHFLKANDPFDRPTTASMSGGWYWSAGYHNVDMPNVHLYETGWTMRYPGNPLRSSAWLYHDISNDFWSDFIKPGIMGEAGYTNSYGNYATPSDEYTTLYHNALWSSWASGLSMTPVWWAFNSSDIMSPEVMEQMAAFSAVVPDFDYANQLLSPVDLSAVDFDAYIMQNQITAFGWIREIYGSDVSGKMVTIFGLADTSYNVEWYNTWTGEQIIENIAVAVDSQLTITTPSIGTVLPDLAFILRPAEEGDVPAQLDLNVPLEVMLVNSPDRATIICTVRDNQGRFVGSATNLINFSLSGPGSLIGPSTVQAVGGIASIEFQTDSITGTARIIAFSAGLQPDTVLIEVMDIVVIDNFESYSSTTSLQSAWAPRPGTTANISLETSIVGEGEQSMKMIYAIGSGYAPYSGIFKRLSGDYRGAHFLSFWIQPDNSQRTLAILLTEESGQYWQSDLILDGIQGEFVNIPLDQFQSSGDTTGIDLVHLKEISFNILPGNGGFGMGSLFFDRIIFVFSSTIIGIPEIHTNILPINYALFQNYPNPFNASTWITYTLPVQSKVQLDVYTITGQRVAQIIRETQKAGVHKAEWQPGDLASGVYIYKLKAENYSSVKKCILLK